MTVQEIIEKRRSIRRFTNEPVTDEEMRLLIKAGRLAPQASNIQPVRYITVQKKETVQEIFECTKWAGYLEDYAPKEGERPTAFIIVLLDESIAGGMKNTDVGAAVENILLQAVELGLGSCWIGSVDRRKTAEIIDLPENMSIHSVIALGHPAQDPVWEDKKDDSIRYYLDENGELHVPKRTESEIWLNRF